MRRLQAVAIILLGLATAGCGGDDPQGTTVTAPPAATPLDDECARHGSERRKRFHVTDGGFLPRKAIVTGGQPVTFVNCGDGPHTVTQVRGPGAPFDSGELQPGEVFDKTFVSEGTHIIEDRRKPGARLTLEVRGSSAEPAG